MGEPKFRILGALDATTLSSEEVASAYCCSDRIVNGLGDFKDV